jgi:predicted molibdopterin-dependent oxidoreductase YjgC
MVEVEGSRTLVPACSREVSEGLEVKTDSARVGQSRKLVYELLVSSVDMSLVDEPTLGWMDHYGVDTEKFGVEAATVEQPVKIQDNLYIRDYSKCILCYKCVEACGEDAQNTFAISAAGRGFDAVISTEFDEVLPESACVYCGNCVAVCPTGALMFKTEYDMREAGTWNEENQTVTTTICPYCGVGCNLELHVQDNKIIKVTSPMDHSVTSGHLCIKGRFGYEHVQN